MFSAKFSVKPRYNEPARSVRLGPGGVELPNGGVFGREVVPSFPRKVVLNNKTAERPQRPQNGPIVLFDTTTRSRT